MTQYLQPLVTVVGPTGAGKSDLAIAIAQAFRGEIINCDSLQTFRYFEIGTAKTPLAERHGIAHHMIDVINPDALMTAGEYARLAREMLKDVTKRGKLPIVCGGTGFYLRALLEGLSPSPERDEALRYRLMKCPDPHRLLLRLDPEAAGRIDAADTNKVIRALEIRILSGKPALELMAGKRDALEGYRILKLGLNPTRLLLNERIKQRSKNMFAGGLLDEVRSILAMGYPETAKPFEAIGYKESLQALHGEISAAQAQELTETHTRQYAKRQLTWFRRDKEIHWIEEFGQSPPAIEQALQRVRDFSPFSK